MFTFRRMPASMLAILVLLLSACAAPTKIVIEPTQTASPKPTIEPSKPTIEPTQTTAPKPTIEPTQTAIEPPQTTIDQALQQRIITADFETKLSYGDVMTATFNLTGDQAITLDIPRGTVLRNTAGERESFVVYQFKGRFESATSTELKQAPSIILSTSGREYIALLECYSLNTLLPSAQETDDFAVNGTVPAETQAVLDAFEPNDSIEARQIAVWATTDNASQDDLDSIQMKYSEKDATAAKAILGRAKLDPSKYALFR